ncbi:MAG: murein transglycosylase A [Pikeienuella sp.]
MSVAKNPALPSRRAVMSGFGTGMAAALTFGCMESLEPTPRQGHGGRILSFADLPGWAADDHFAALEVYQNSFSRARSGGLGPTLADDWPRPTATDARGFFEENFTPVAASGAKARFTAYYEPELAGSRNQGGPYQHPLYARPPELKDGRQFLSREQISNGALAGRGLELFWLTDPVESFFLHIQGSGRIRLPDGSVTRVGYAGQNGHAYSSIGRILVEAGAMSLNQASAQSIKTWVRDEPVRGKALLNKNASYVFFKERTELAPELGPVGALGLPLTPGRSVAVDPSIQPLGAPIWVETDGAPGYQGRLMVAQDVGGAIKGPQRADLFIGSGDTAGQIAGRVRSGGRLVTLLPNRAAARMIQAPSS